MTLANAKPDLLLTGPLGNSMVNAASSAWHDVITVEAKITAAIAYAVSIGAKYCYVPDSFLPYTANLVTFNSAVLMLREGGPHDAYDAKAYGAAGNGSQDDAAAIQAAINGAQTTDNGKVILPPGHFRTLTSPIITSDHLSFEGAGPALSTLQPEVGPALTLNTTDGSVFGPTLRYFGVRPTIAVGGQYLIDIASGLPSISNILVSCPGTGAIASGWAGVIRFQEVNGAELRDVRIQGLDADLWPIGLDICPSVTGNRGNVTIIGGFINRCSTAVRIANGAVGLVNNIQLFGTKILFNGSGAAVGGIGIQAATMRLLTLHGVHIESHDISLDLTQVLGADIASCRLVNFGTPAGGANQIAVNMKTACDAIHIRGCEFDSGAISVGTCLKTDATAHSQILPLGNRYLKFATVWTDLATGSDRALWTQDASVGFDFWFKGKVRSNSFTQLPSNVTLGAGNNNNQALAAGGIWRVTNDAGGSTLTGIVAGTQGQGLRLTNIAGGTLTITNNDAASTAGNRFLTPTAASVTVAANHSADIWYDSSSTAWRVVQAIP